MKLKRMVKVEYRKEPGLYHSEVYHEQTVDHIKLYDKSTEAGEYDLASTNMQSYGNGMLLLVILTVVLLVMQVFALLLLQLKLQIDQLLEWVRVSSR